MSTNLLHHPHVTAQRHIGRVCIRSFAPVLLLGFAFIVDGHVVLGYCTIAFSIVLYVLGVFIGERLRGSPKLRAATIAVVLTVACFGVLAVWAVILS